MKTISVLLACAAILPAQEIMKATAEIGSGLIVRYTVRVEPPLKNSQLLKLWGGVDGGRTCIHRSMIDDTTHTIVGYDLYAEPAGAPDRFLVRIEPLTKTMTAGNVIPLPKYPAPQIVNEGDTIALDLLASPDGKQKLVDYIEIARKLDPPPAKPGPAPRDFTLDDGPLALHFESPTAFYIDGRKFAGMVGFTGKPGATLWFAIPDRPGRFILSLAPHARFRRAGVIRDNVLTFEDGGNAYEYRASAPILGAGKAWNLYVFHDPSYQPKPAPQPGVRIGIDRLENLLPR